MKSKPLLATKVMMVAAMAVLAFDVPGVRAQSSIPREETWITDRPVYAIVRTPDRVYIGGYFTYIGGQAHNYIAALDITTGAVKDWNPNANDWVGALAVSGTAVYAGGKFTSIGGKIRNRIAALDATTGNATDWNPNANSSVAVLAVSGLTVYAGGYFLAIGGNTSRPYFAQFVPEAPQTQEKIKRYLLGLDPYSEGLDVNGDGKVDIADLVWYLLGYRLAK